MSVFVLFYRWTTINLSWSRFDFEWRGLANPPKFGPSPINSGASRKTPIPNISTRRIYDTEFSSFSLFIGPQDVLQTESLPKYHESWDPKNLETLTNQENQDKYDMNWCIRMLIRWGSPFLNTPSRSAKVRSGFVFDDFCALRNRAWELSNMFHQKMIITY